MLFELKKIIDTAYACYLSKKRCVMATVVKLEGSSYRKPGVRMLIHEDGVICGAVSGGCVEKAIIDETQSVFKNRKSKIMTYDGRYRLGCEGILTILLEETIVDENINSLFNNAVKTRNPVKTRSYFSTITSNTGGYTQILLNGKFTNFNGIDIEECVIEDAEIFEHELEPIFRLIIIGAEHDAVSLSKMGQSLGWQVELILHHNNSYNLELFNHIERTHIIDYAEIDKVCIDGESAVIIMTHNFAKDLGFLSSLINTEASYIGIIGNKKRKNNLVNQLMDNTASVPYDFINRIHCPAGLDIGSVTPAEISLSIIAEILSCLRE